MPTTEDDPLQHWSSLRRRQVDALLLTRFGDAWPARFQQACRYPVEAGGKRIRPLLCLAAAEALGRSTDEALLRVAAAVELVHTYSLVHDDLPAMDDDDERRGRPTVHRAFDEATAILVGDALLTEAFVTLAEAPLPPAVQARLVRELGLAAGHRGMVGGQAMDVGLGGPVTELEDLTRLHRGKTGALIRSAVRMGGIAAEADPEPLSALGRYGEAVGLAFQLADDVLDASQDAGSDGPPSYVKLLGLEETTRRAQALANEACQAVAELPQPEMLVALARFSVSRRS